VRPDVVGAPDPLENLVVAQYPVLIPNQEGEKARFGSRQQQLRAIEEDLMLAFVDDQRPHDEPLGTRRCGPGAPENSLYTSHELIQPERLPHVIVRAHLKGARRIGLMGEHREHDDRHVGLGTEDPAGGEPIHAGHSDVQDYERRLELVEELDGLVTVATGEDEEAVGLEGSRKNDEHAAVIVCD